MKKPLTEDEWQRVRRAFGDVAYENPEMHRVLLEVLEKEKPAD